MYRALKYAVLSCLPYFIGELCRLHKSISNNTIDPLCVYWAVQWSWFAQVNALCNLLHKKPWEVAASLLGRFLSRCCFTLCIRMEAEPIIAKQYKCHHCCSCKNYEGKGIHRIFFGWPEDREFMEKKIILGHPVAQATSCCLLPDTFSLWASNNILGVGSVKTAFHYEESMHWK